MTESDMKADLSRYLQASRDALVWKLAGASEYDIRRPLTPTGTNLLGLVKHVAGVEIGYFGATFQRPFARPPRWLADDADPQGDMWADAEESREAIVALYHRAWSHADETIGALPLQATGRVQWWPAERAQVTLHKILVHVIAETARHAGHADILRELTDGEVGLRHGNHNMAAMDRSGWQDHVSQVERAARQAGEPATDG